MTTTTKVVTAHVPLALADKLDAAAARLERSRAWIIKQALSDWIAEEEARDRLTREALAEVDAGQVTEHEAVRTWAERLDSEQPLPPPL